MRTPPFIHMNPLSRNPGSAAIECARSEGSYDTMWTLILAWVSAARHCDKYQYLVRWSDYITCNNVKASPEL